MDPLGKATTTTAVTAASDTTTETTILCLYNLQTVESLDSLLAGGAGGRESKGTFTRGRAFMVPLFLSFGWASKTYQSPLCAPQP